MVDIAQTEGKFAAKIPKAVLGSPDRHGLMAVIRRMRNNPRGWSIADLKALATRFGIDWRQPGTSHVTFSYPGTQPLTVPARKPVKPIYVARFLELLERIGEGHGEADDEG